MLMFSMFSSGSFSTFPGQERAFLWSKLCPKYLARTEISPIRLILGYQSLTIHIHQDLLQTPPTQHAHS